MRIPSSVASHTDHNGVRFQIDRKLWVMSRFCYWFCLEWFGPTTVTTEYLSWKMWPCRANFRPLCRLVSRASVVSFLWSSIWNVSSYRIKTCLGIMSYDNYLSIYSLFYDRWQGQSNLLFFTEYLFLQFINTKWTYDITFVNLPNCEALLSSGLEGITVHTRLLNLGYTDGSS